MNDTSPEHLDKKPGDIDEPPPPTYHEAIMHEGSEVRYAGTSSSGPRAELSATARCTLPDAQLTSLSPNDVRPASSPPDFCNSSRAVVADHMIANERPRDPQRPSVPPRVLLPPSAPPPLGLGPSTEPCGRPPPQHLSYDPFPPAVLNAHSDDLAQGFPLEPPLCPCEPGQQHPFVIHDVNEDDWARFLHDVRVSGSGLTPVNPMLADAAPRAVKTGVLVGFVADMALRVVVKGKKKSPVADAIAYWNQRFFHPRLMHVVLAQGAVTYTGPEGALPPDMTWMSNNGLRNEGGYAPGHDDGGSGETDRGLRRAERRGLVRGIGGSLCELAGLTATDRRERGDFSRDLQASAGEKWRLIIAYKPSTF
ncbi:hypothetical protein C8T65DRAFT_646548 [Cerioporus squamosus]|nr:hypothetical protein C8T65DRAFT_646548 [Cerioporus squamosus]